MSSIKKNFFYNTLYQILTIIIPLITTPYISRVLGVGGVGEYSYNYAIVSYFVLFIMLGVNNYGNREIARAKNDENELDNSFWQIYYFQLLCGITSTSIYLVYSYFFATNRLVAMVMSLYCLAATIDVGWFFAGMEMFRLLSLRNIVIKIITTVSIFLFVKSDTDVWKYCLLLSFGTLIQQLLLWKYIKRLIKYVRPDFVSISKHIRPNLTLFMTVIAISLYKIMDKIMLGLMSSKIDVGYYESSEKLIQIPTALINSLGTVMLPRMSSLYQYDRKKAHTMIKKSIYVAMLLACPLSFGIMGVSKEFVPIFFGIGYSKCVYVLQILLPSCVFLSLANVVRTQILLPCGMDDKYVVSSFGGAVINFIINMIVITKFGAVGAAVGTLFAEAFVCIYQINAVKNMVSIKKYVISTLPLLESSIIMYFVVWNFTLDLAPTVLLSIKILLGCFIYFISVIILSLVHNNQEYKELLKVRIHKKR